MVVADLPYLARGVIRHYGEYRCFPSLTRGVEDPLTEVPRAGVRQLVRRAPELGAIGGAAEIGNRHRAVGEHREPTLPAGSGERLAARA